MSLSRVHPAPELSLDIKLSEPDKWGKQDYYDCPDGERRVRVTSVCNVLGKPALIYWATNLERELVTEAAADLYDDIPINAPKMMRMVYVETLRKRMGKEKAHQKELAKASEIGKQAHHLIEWRLRRELNQETGKEPHVSDKVAWAVMAWEDWRKSVDFSPLYMEQKIWSQRYGYAGTMDLIAELSLPEGKRKVVVDWKTGKAIYPEALLQNAAYVCALQEMGHVDSSTEGLIVRLPKVETDPAFEARVVTTQEIEDCFGVFLGLIQAWHFLKRMES